LGARSTRAKVLKSRFLNSAGTLHKQTSVRNSPGRLLGVVVLMSAWAVPPLAASGDPRKDFEKRWESRYVVVKQTLLTLVYDERGHIGITSRKRDGLTVVTSSGAYLQFKGRYSEEDIVEREPDRLVDAVRKTYLTAYTVDSGWYYRVNPIVVERFEAGAILVVRDVQLDDHVVRLSFVDDRNREFATALTVKWAAPLSRPFAEAPLVEDLIRQYVDPV
jgi:hypothetical protein